MYLTQAQCILHRHYVTNVTLLKMLQNMVLKKNASIRGGGSRVRYHCNDHNTSFNVSKQHYLKTEQKIPSHKETCNWSVLREGGGDYLPCGTLNFYDSPSPQQENFLSFSQSICKFDLRAFQSHHLLQTISVTNDLCDWWTNSTAVFNQPHQLSWSCWVIRIFLIVWNIYQLSIQFKLVSYKLIVIYVLCTVQEY